MKCAWQAFINLLPIWMRQQVDRLGQESLQELRLRLHQNPILVTSHGRHCLNQVVTAEDLSFVINIASRYSPWAAQTVSSGYLTAPGGHRIGICGDAVVQNSEIRGIRAPTSLCIRVARDFSGIASAVDMQHSTLIIGRPGSGKTTLLRDLIRCRSDTLGQAVAVVDEKQELFPYSEKNLCFTPGQNTDILTGCSKIAGIEMVLRNMSPDVIAVDEITAEQDCEALLHAGWCGVQLLATAHAGSIEDLQKRLVYKPILDSRLFETLVVIRQDKSWYTERMKQ